MAGFTTRRLVFAGLLAIAAAACGSSREEVAPACDRDCLKGFIDRYLAAVVAHDPAQAPLSETVKFTENAQRLEVGDGLWNTASGGASKKLYFADVEAGQAGLFGVMQESGAPILIALRLKVEGGKISEAETVIIRSGAGFANFERPEPSPLWEEVLASPERSEREVMIDVTNRYFDALEKSLIDHVPFDDACKRIENGVQTTGDKARPPFPSADYNVGAMGCRDNVNSPIWAYITKIEPRRFLIQDVERGVSMGVFMFHHAGTIESVTLPNGQEMKMSGAMRRPFTTVIPEMFKIRNGKVVEIEAIMASLPYGSKSGWDE